MNRSERMKRMWQDEDMRQRLIRKAPQSSSAKAKIAASKAAAWQALTQEQRAALKQRISEAVRAAWADPEKKAARLAKRKKS